MAKNQPTPNVTDVHLLSSASQCWMFPVYLPGCTPDPVLCVPSRLTSVDYSNGLPSAYCLYCGSCKLRPHIGIHLLNFPPSWVFIFLPSYTITSFNFLKLYFEAKRFHWNLFYLKSIVLRGLDWSDCKNCLASSALRHFSIDK